MDSVFRNDTEYAARQRHFDRQMGTHSHVRRHLRHYMALHNTKPQPVMRIASPADKPMLSWTKLFCLAWIAPILMSGVIEILQEYCTGGRRSGDWLDFAANSIGATVGAVAGVGMVMLKRRHRF